MKAHLFAKRILALSASVFLVACFGFFSPNSYGAIIDSKNEDEIDIIKGDLETIQVFDLTRISITQPEIADIANIDSDHILMLAKQSGQTTLFIWDKYGKRSILIRVLEDDLNLVKSRLQQLLGEAGIKGIQFDINKLEGKLIASGEVAEDQKEALNRLLDPFSGSLVNLVKDKKEEDLIQIDAQISELSSSYSKNMGFEWTSALTYAETLPGFNPNAPTDFFKIGDFHRTTQILANINALITEGKGRVLSKPKLVCISGKEASFLVGGEIPITTTTASSGGNVQENVEYRNYGVNLTVSPTIRNNKVDIVLNINVSDIDASNSVGKNVAFTTRTAQTQLYLDNGQTVVLAGLIKHNEGETIRRIPILSDIPIVGAVFRSRKNPTANTETELIITLTPTILTQKGEIASSENYNVTTTDVTDQSMKTTETKLPSEPTSATSKSFVSSSAMTTKTFIPQEMASYMRSIQRRIAQKVIYPEKARQYGWEGTVKLALHILNDGTLAHATVRESSGYDLFDQDALNAAKNLAPYSEFPSELNLQEVTVTIPIVYSLNNK